MPIAIRISLLMALFIFSSYAVTNSDTTEQQQQQPSKQQNNSADDNNTEVNNDNQTTATATATVNPPMPAKTKRDGEQDSFIPSEQVSEDLAVSFPVDI